MIAEKPQKMEKNCGRCAAFIYARSASKKKNQKPKRETAMFDNLVILSWYVIAILSMLCTGAVIGDLIMERQDERARRCFYGHVNTGACLKPRAKKSKFNITTRNMLAKLRFN